MTAASSQIVSSTSRSQTVVETKKEPKQKKPKKETRSATIYFAYEMPAYKLDGEGETMAGFAAGFVKNVKLSSTMPLFLDLGISGNVAMDNWVKRDAETTYLGYNDENDVYVYRSDAFASILAHIAIPIGVSYRFPLTKSIAVVPAAGVNMRIGVYNTNNSFTSLDFITDLDSQSGYNAQLDDVRDYYDPDENCEVDDYYNNGDASWSRFTAGVYIGGSIEIKRLSLGVVYNMDFMPVVENGAKYSALSCRLGLRL